MSIPTHHILPPSTFRHIGIMVMFMSLITGLCATGYVVVENMTKGWIVDIDNTLNIEIPSYNEETDTVSTTENMNRDLEAVHKYLLNDPLVKNIFIDQPDPLKLSDTATDDFIIPAPIFITISLPKNRAENAEQRLIDNIKSIVPNIFFKTSQTWEQEIQKNARLLSLAFGGLTLFVYIVTAFLISAIIRSQLMANIDTIHLIHLMGASSSVISRLFQASITKPVLWGGVIGLGLSTLLFSSLTSFYSLNVDRISFYTMIGMIFVVFILVCRWITLITVLRSLSKLP